MKQIVLEDMDSLPDAAEMIINEIGTRHVIALCGGMGAGKTTLTAEIVKQLGSEDTVTSPTFALVNQYSTDKGENIYHFDFYRIKSPEEAFDIGYEEYFYSGELCIVEWAEKIEELLPQDTMRVNITVSDEGKRIITIS